MTDRIACASALSKVAAGLLVGGGVALAGCFVANGLQDIKRGERYVTVKGLVERYVTADLALWTLKTKVAGEDLAVAQQSLDTNVQRMRTFLVENGIKEEDIALKGVRVVDRMAQEYGDNRPGQARYILEASLSVRSGNVESVKKVSQLTNALVKSGVTLAEDNNCTPGPVYLFTKLNDIKPDMLAEATKNARASAGQFAKDSGSSVGAIRRASQGVFSISSRDEVNENNEGGGCTPSDMEKKVRVVTTVDYYLE